MATNPLTRTPHFSLGTAMEAVQSDPSFALRVMREKLPDLPFVVGREFLGAVTDNTHKVIVMGHDEDFDVAWQMARLLHNLNKNHDALTYVARARELAPDNAKVVARHAEILLALHEELPNGHYDDAAQYAAADAYALEQSEYTLALLERAGVSAGTIEVAQNAPHLPAPAH